MHQELLQDVVAAPDIGENAKDAKVSHFRLCGIPEFATRVPIARFPGKLWQYCGK